MLVSDVASVTIGLSAVPASVASYTTPILLVDHADIPLDLRYTTTTKTTYTTDLTASTAQVGWCAALWGQQYNPTTAYIGRWIAAASSPYVVCVGFQTTIATWAAVSDGTLTVTTDAGADVMTAIDFTGDLTLSDVAASIQVKLTAGGTSGALCTVDSQDRIIFTDPVITGAGSETVVLSGGGGVTDIYVAGFLNGASSFQVGGADIEAQGTAAAAILAKNNAPYIWCQRGGSVAQLTAFSTYINSLDKYLYILDDDPNAKDSTDATDVAYAIEALGHNKTAIFYSEHTTTVGAAADQYADAAVIGEINARLDKEGAVSLALNALTGVSESGLHSDLTTVIPLTSAERSALEAKGCDYLVKPATSVHLAKGLAAGGQEVRVMQGKAFMAASISTDIYNYLLANEVVVYADADVLAFKTIVEYWANEMADRKLLDRDTFVYNFPLASTFNAAAKASHRMTLSDVFTSEYLASVNDVAMTLSFSL